MKLAQVRRFAMSLPDVTEEPHFNYTSFRVGGRIFATVPPEGEHLHVFVEGSNASLPWRWRRRFSNPFCGASAW